MNIFLPPAPHSANFFDTVRGRLNDLPTEALNYPGYGGEPRASEATIETYAAALSPKIPKGTPLVGFHTGCLVATEIALQKPGVGQLILVDVPFFDLPTRKRHAAGLDPDDPAQDAFRAAFAYATGEAMHRLDHPVTMVATNSPLLEPTRRAASLVENCRLLTRPDIDKPAFESEALAGLLRELLSDNSQSPADGRS